MMFSKLFKHEMKATSRIFLIAWPTLLVLALLNGFGAAWNRTYMVPGNIFADSLLQMLGAMAFGMVFIGVMVMTLVVIIKRFYDGLLKDEGYLTFTLPVTTRRILTAKGLSATVLMLISGLVALLSILFWILPTYGFTELGATLAQLMQMLSYVDGWPLYAVEFFVLTIVSVMASVYQLYAAMSLGQLAQKHKIAFSFLAYVGISIVVSFVGGILGMLGAIPGMDPLVLISASNINQQEMSHIILLGYVLLELVQLIAFHVIAEYTLDRKLNLE